MRHILIDSNVLLDIFLNDPVWSEWSENVLDEYSISHTLCINPVIYAEISIGFSRIEEFESVLNDSGIKVVEIPHEGLFLAGKAFLKYRKNKGTKPLPLPDFFIGSHAAVSGMDLITRDTSRIRTYFPTVKTISP